MRLSGDLRPAVFRRRLNRFAAEVECAGRMVPAHVPNSGRLRELLQPGASVWLTPVVQGRRKTAFDLSLAVADHTLVSVDARLPSGLVREALEAGRLRAFAAYRDLRPEVPYGRSRLDFRLEGGGPPVLLEVKSVTLVRDGTALFPDAPTARGVRHLEELTRAVAEGLRGAVLFVVQRGDARRFAPHATADPVFADALRGAAAAGVEVYAHPCRVTRREVILQAAALPTEL